ncbi:MAG: hypothetical protein KGH57_00155 [Candidatus Micrarchaeota archaeon]|nr:hypothetical protein [Candidatus Micrarchaeota archaeon]
MGEKERERAADFVEQTQEQYHKMYKHFNDTNHLASIIDLGISSLQSKGAAMTPEERRWYGVLKLAKHNNDEFKTFLSGSDINRGDERTADSLAKILGSFDPLMKNNDSFEQNVKNSMQSAKQELLELTAAPTRLNEFFSEAFVTPSGGNQQFGDAFHELDQYLKKEEHKHSAKWIVRNLTGLAQNAPFKQPKTTDEQMVTFLETYAQMNVPNLHVDQIRREHVVSLYTILDEASDIMTREGVVGAYAFLNKMVGNQEEIRRRGMSNTVLLPGMEAQMKAEAKAKIGANTAGHMLGRMNTLEEFMDDRLSAKDKKAQRLISSQMWQLAKEKEAMKAAGAFEDKKAAEVDKRFEELQLHLELVAKKRNLNVTSRTLTTEDVSQASKHIGKMLTAAEDDAVDQIADNYVEISKIMRAQFGVQRWEMYEKFDEYFLRNYALRDVLRTSPKPAIKPGNQQVTQVGGP